MYYNFLSNIMISLGQQKTQQILINALKIIRMYDWILDLYVLDFFVDDHWQKLPQSWRECLQDMDPQDLGAILHGDKRKMFPLSLLALLTTVEVYSINRKVTKSYHRDTKPDNESKVNCGNHPRLKNLFLKHVKLKKRHEVSQMAEVAYNTAKETGCNSVLDFGSGLGHLIRVLSYKHDIHAVGIECQGQLTEAARKLDKELEYTASKYLSENVMSDLCKPIHLNITLKSQEQLQHIDLPATMSQFGLVGLHPCGDLGPLLLKHFVACDRVKFICIVGCCYMKLTCEAGAGYPLSSYIKTLDWRLSYASREIACHAIEVYCDRLRKGDYEDLKIHAFRAALERILVSMDPRFHHAPVRSIKHTQGMTFHRYCELALSRLTKLSIPALAQSAVTAASRDVDQWQRVVVVYSLRLALAPLVETVILMDRVLFLLEHGLSCEIQPVFDPTISPRNHVIIGRRL